MMIQREVADAIAESSTTMARVHDKNRHPLRFDIGDRVFIEARPNLKIPGFAHLKVGSRRFGPFEIIEAVGPSAYKLRLPDSYRMHNVINVQHLTKLPADKYNCHDTYPPPVVMENDNFADYEVKNVIDSQIRRNQKQYLVKFKGYPVSESLWYDKRDSASFSNLVKEYKARLASRKVRKR